MSTISSFITNVCQPLIIAPADDALEAGINDSWRWWVGFHSPQFLAGAGKKYTPPGNNPQPGLSACRVLQLDQTLITTTATCWDSPIVWLLVISSLTSSLSSQCFMVLSPKITHSTYVSLPRIFFLMTVSYFFFPPWVVHNSLIACAN